MIWVLQRLHHRQQYGSVMCWNIMHQFKPIMHFEMEVSSCTWSCAARVLQLQYPDCCSCLSTYWNVAAWFWILKGCLYNIYFNNNFRRLYKIDVYLFCSGMWEAVKTLLQCGNVLWALFPTLVWFWLQKLSLKACLAGSLPLLLKHINTQVLWSDSRSWSWIIDLSNLVKQAVSQGVG